MPDIISPIQSDGIVLTPAQKEARHKEKVEAFKIGLRKVEEETGMTLMITLRYLPTGIFPSAQVVERAKNSEVKMEGTPEENADKSE